MAAKSPFGPRGTRLMQQLVARDGSLEDDDNPFREVATAACETADRVAHLQQIAREVESVIEGQRGPTMHPIFAEVRQQEAALARLISALRLPDEATGKRPQKRQVRGVQQPSKVSSLERARQRQNAG